MDFAWIKDCRSQRMPKASGPIISDNVQLRSGSTISSYPVRLLEAIPSVRCTLCVARLHHSSCLTERWSSREGEKSPLWLSQRHLKLSESPPTLQTRRSTSEIRARPVLIQLASIIPSTVTLSGSLGKRLYWYALDIAYAGTASMGILKRILIHLLTLYERPSFVLR